ncbi:hypothetical protein BGP77_11515 [Saccharospirillum sp. MSK14-1]|uniref:hypothetical protein n=1 Tax=Saccharospirillum sp. MSK14-1 TaxID=1897632 RepID=UPI000D3AC2DA|nr:hypothetical protein [Saccharospirillum sp. MSK14-1]PTY38568.1 hypothetical protein BGP77_11515 [Saccharospirillum sp. MSK14-1]
MNERIVAIDPGTDASGVAVFTNGKLTELTMMNLPTLVDYIQVTDAHYVIENVEANKFIYARNKHPSQSVTLKMAQSVGLVKATARHIMTFMTWHKKAYTPIKPTPDNWGTMDAEQGKRALQTMLGWTGESNKDTRSAAFFGNLYIRQLTRKARIKPVV